jgi:hypothetical protein
VNRHLSADAATPAKNPIAQNPYATIPPNDAASTARVLVSRRSVDHLASVLPRLSRAYGSRSGGPKWVES